MAENNKSLLSTINTGFNSVHIKTTLPKREYVDKSLSTLNTGFILNIKPFVPEAVPEINTSSGLFPESVKLTIALGYPEELLIPTKDITLHIYVDNTNVNISTGFIHNDKPVITPTLPNIQISDKLFEESIKPTVDTGFGIENKIELDCPSPNLVIRLAKENYLSEFKEDFEKEKARNNLGVYSKAEVDKITSNLILNVSGNFVTKTEMTTIIEGLEYVDSTLKSHANYNIPETLFKL